MSWTAFEYVDVRMIAGQRGVFARRRIRAGTVLGFFDGRAEVFELRADGSVDWRGLDGGMSIHVTVTDGRLFALMPIDGQDISGIDYINHSCRPNCRVKAGGLMVEALRDIDMGEQLTIDYGRMDLVKLGKPCWCEAVPDGQRCVL
ncbi:SET domain-containing protein-lysine N-methyltransferase [Azospirillum sp. sgz302134]